LFGIKSPNKILTAFVANVRSSDLVPRTVGNSERNDIPLSKKTSRYSETVSYKLLLYFLDIHRPVPVLTDCISLLALLTLLKLAFEMFLVCWGLF